MEDLKNFFQGNYDANLPKMTDQQQQRCNTKGQASCFNWIAFTPYDNDN